MPEWNEGILEGVLRRLDDPSGSPAPSPEGERTAREISRLARALRSGTRPGEHHFGLSELMVFSEERRRRGEAWEMPDHLATCPPCLEAFGAVLSGDTAARPEAVDRFVEIMPDLPPATLTLRRPVPLSRTIFRGAAALALAAVLAIGFFMGLRAFNAKSPATATAPGLALESGEAIMQGEAVPRRVVLLARQATEIAFADGSKVAVEESTKLSVRESLWGNVQIDLTRGALTASVAKRKEQRFTVQTPLGSATVVGTRFRVEARNDNVFPDPNAPQADPAALADRVTSVTVQVTEGKVRVRSKAEEKEVAAGQTAYLHEGDERIPIYPSPR